MIFNDVLVSSTLTLVPVNIFTWKKEKPCSPGATKMFVPRARITSDHSLFYVYRKLSPAFPSKGI